MTRINLIDPSLLSQKMLCAEYREVMRLPGNLRASLNRKSKPFSKSEISSEYLLGPGHVKFFFDKMLFIEKRFISLVNEMINRGYKPNFTDPSIFQDCSVEYYNDYTPTPKAIEINKQRIKERTKS